MTKTQPSDARGIVVFHNKNTLPYIAVPHLHSEYEICYNVEGGKGFLVGGEFYKLGRRDLILIPKVVAHKVLVSPHAEYERIIINIDDDSLSRLRGMEMDGNISDFLTECEHPRMVTLCEDQHKQLLTLIGEYGNENSAQTVLYKLLAFLRDALSHSRPAGRMEDSDLSYADRVFSVIEKSFATVTVSKIAEQLYLNEDHICRVFKKETGVTIKHYLTRRKLAEAKKYLYLGHNVREAGTLSGFHDYANFIRTFKKYEGYSPGNMEGLEKPI